MVGRNPITTPENEIGGEIDENIQMQRFCGRLRVRGEMLRGGKLGKFEVQGFI
jgi:hypothetical protein